MKAIIICGVTKGYFHANENNLDMNTICETIKEVSNKLEAQTGVYVSGVVSDTRVTYKTEWGCPVGEERVFKFEATQNPEFSKEKDWKISVVEFATALKEEYKQKTLTLEFVESDMMYI